jgi:hypothetical protein
LAGAETLSGCVINRTSVCVLKNSLVLSVEQLSTTTTSSARRV